jgi:hypothetical protein
VSKQYFIFQGKCDSGPCVQFGREGHIIYLQTPGGKLMSKKRKEELASFGWRDVDTPLLFYLLMEWCICKFLFPISLSLSLSFSISISIFLILFFYLSFYLFFFLPFFLFFTLEKAFKFNIWCRMRNSFWVEKITRFIVFSFVWEKKDLTFFEQRFSFAF